MEIVYFATKEAFYEYLLINNQSEQGIWIRFEKEDIPNKLTPDQALETALCFGWIDGQIKKENEQTYIKYFTKRRKNSIWSTRNKKIATRLIQEGRMMESGNLAIASAKKDGRWEKADLLPPDFSLDAFSLLIQKDEKANINWQKMSPSIQKTYAISYFVLKKQESRDKRLLVILDRLRQNLRPM